MSEVQTCKKTDNGFMTSYQRAHYYQNLQNIQHCMDSSIKSRRPDLHIYDPVIDKKSSTYKIFHNKKTLDENPVENYRRVYFAQKSTLKDLLNDFNSKPPKSVECHETTAGRDYKDINGTIEDKLDKAYSVNCPPIKASCSFGLSGQSESADAYISVTHSDYKNLEESSLYNLARTGRIKYSKPKCPATEKFVNVEPRVFFKVPFGADASIYKGDFKDPELKNAYLVETCEFPSHFDALKTQLPMNPPMYSTEQQTIGQHNCYITS